MIFHAKNSRFLTNKFTKNIFFTFMIFLQNGIFGCFCPIKKGWILSQLQLPLVFKTPFQFWTLELNLKSSSHPTKQPWVHLLHYKLRYLYTASNSIISKKWIAISHCGMRWEFNLVYFSCNCCWSPLKPKAF